MQTVGNSERHDVPLVAFVLGISLIIAVILGHGWWSINQDRTLTLAAAQEHSLLAVRVLEEHASRVMHDAEHAIVAVSQEIRDEIERAPGNNAALRAILLNQRQDIRLLYALSLLDEQGERKTSTLDAPAELRGQQAPPHLRYLLEHRDHIPMAVGMPLKLGQAEHWVLPVARNLFDLSGRWLGIVQADIDLSYFQEFYERIAQGNDAVMSLHDSSGKVFVRAPYDALYLGTDANAAAPALLKVLHGSAQEGAVVDDPLLDGESNALYAYRKMPDFPLILVYARKLDDILADWNNRVRQKLVFAAGITAFILGLVLILLWQIRYLRQSRRQLESSEGRYRLLYQGAQDAILLINREYTYVDCNPAAVKLFGVQSEDDIIGHRAGGFSKELQTVDGLPHHDKETLVVTLVDLAFKGIPQRFEWVTQRDGQLQYNEISLNRVEVDDEPLLFCVERDINARKYAEHLLEGQNRLLHLIGGDDDLPFILEAICQFVEKLCPHWRCGIQLLADDQRSFAHCVGRGFPEVLKAQLPGMSVAYGNGVWSEAALNGLPALADDIQHAPSMQFVNALETLLNYASCGAWPVFGKNGQLLGSVTLFFSSRAPLTDEDLGLIGITTDITGIAIEGRRSEKKILQLAHYDELTGLPNRFLYNQHLAKSLALGERNRTQLAVLFLDLDRFKNINDTFGHDEGDKVLRNVARRFRECLRDSDTIARVGGDEFILLVDQFREPRDLGDIAGKLLFEASQPFEIAGQECQLSASIGIATYPEDGKDAQTLLKNADIAMYRAKNKGKNNYQFYASEMNIHTVDRLAFEARLRKALERREFVVHYQPKVDIQSGIVVGAEALVRWSHPERGIIFPGDFIALAEEAGLVGRIGMLVLDIACRDILNFRNVDKNFGRVAINLSGAQFNDVHMLDEVNNVVDFWRIPANSIEFEITESMVMHNREQAIILMDGLKAAGFTLSIDDFGTGYSSLAYLKRFPVDSVKVDRSFIKDIPEDPNDTAIVLAIVAMAHTLGLKVIAEGVESELQLDTLRESRCDEYQGYYFSKAIPDHEFLQLLQKQANGVAHI